MYSFGKASAERLSKLAYPLQFVLMDAIKVMDFSIIETARDKQTQDNYYKTGLSQLKYPESMHNKTPALAFDIYPYVKGIGALTLHPLQIERIADERKVSLREAEIWSRNQYYKLNGVIMACAKARDVQLTWGGDWKTFIDLPHYEQKRK